MKERTKIVLINKELRDEDEQNQLIDTHKKYKILFDIDGRYELVDAAFCDKDYDQELGFKELSKFLDEKIIK